MILVVRASQPSTDLSECYGDFSSASARIYLR